MNCSQCGKSLQAFSRSDQMSNPQKASYRCFSCRLTFCADCSYSAAKKAGKASFICPVCKGPATENPDLFNSTADGDVSYIGGRTVIRI